MSGRRHHYEIVGGFLVQLVGDAHLGTLTSFENDGLVSLQLLEPKGIWPRNDGHIIAGTSELVRECTTDLTGTDDGNRQRRFSWLSYIFHDDFPFDSFSSGQGWLSVDDVADPVQLMPGDCFLVPRGQPFCLASDLSLASVDAATLFATTENGTIVSLNGGGDCFIVVRTSPWPAIMPLSSWERCRRLCVLRNNGQNGASLLFGSDDQRSVAPERASSVIPKRAFG